MSIIWTSPVFKHPGTVCLGTKHSGFCTFYNSLDLFEIKNSFGLKTGLFKSPVFGHLLHTFVSQGHTPFKKKFSFVESAPWLKDVWWLKNTVKIS